MRLNLEVSGAAKNRVNCENEKAAIMSLGVLCADDLASERSCVLCCGMHLSGEQLLQLEILFGF